MKLLNKVGVGVVVVAVLGLASFVAYEKKFENIANNFFESVKQKNPDATRAFLPTNASDREYAALFNDLVPSGLALNFKADGLFSQKGLLFSKEKSISGTINPEGVQKPVPVTVIFVKDSADNNAWKIREVKEDVEKGQPTAAEIQEKAKIMNLVRQSMADFILSKKTKSMDHFYDTLSDEWKKNTTVKDLDKAYEVVLSDETDWGFLNPVEPNIAKYVVKDGVLTVIGVYPSKPKRLIFEHNYIKNDDGGDWKLAGFKLFTSDPEDTESSDTNKTDSQASDEKASDEKASTDNKQ